MNKKLTLITIIIYSISLGILIGLLISYSFDSDETYTDRDHYESCSDGCSNMQRIIETSLNIVIDAVPFNLCVDKCMDKIIE